jgi:hypothetical protein
MQYRPYEPADLPGVPRLYPTYSGPDQYRPEIAWKGRARGRRIAWTVGLTG